MSVPPDSLFCYLLRFQKTDTLWQQSWIRHEPESSPKQSSSDTKLSKRPFKYVIPQLAPSSRCKIFHLSPMACQGRYLNTGEGVRRVEKITHPWASWLVLLTKCYYSDQIRGYEMGQACGTYGGEQKCMYGFDGRTWGKKTTYTT
jgi:hypothetical protein